MKTLVLANHQAAVGKSTVATMLVHHLARHGHRVLAIDLAHPGEMGRSLRRSEKVAVVPLAADALTGNALPRLPDAADRLIVLIDGARRWLGLERQPRQHDNFIENLQDLKAIFRRHFDACIIDTSARPDVRQLAALGCADLVLVPVPLDEASLRRVDYLFWHTRCGLYVTQASLNPNLRLLGLLPTMVPMDRLQHGHSDRLAELVAKHQDSFIRVGGRNNANLNAEKNAKVLGPIGAFAHLPHRPEIAQALASGQMLWEIPATSARAVWNEIRPSIEALAAHLTAHLTAAEVRS